MRYSHDECEEKSAYHLLAREKDSYLLFARITTRENDDGQLPTIIELGFEKLGCR